MYILGTHLSYLALSIGLTVWVAKTLAKSGRTFLYDAFSGNRELAESVNHLLVVGFYLINIGFVCLALKYGPRPDDLPGTIEAPSTKVGLVLFVLGAMHFFNLAVFSRLRRRSQIRDLKPPVAPEYLIDPASAH